MSENLINPKKVAAEKAVEYIQAGMIVGLGTGSTSFFAIQKIGELVKNGLKIKTVASSVQSENQAKELNIPIVPFSDIQSIDI
jgi:ribose 5-phosphate isomerase A